MSEVDPCCRRCGARKLRCVDTLTNFRGDIASVVWVCTNCGNAWRDST